MLQVGGGAGRSLCKYLLIFVACLLFILAMRSLTRSQRSTKTSASQSSGDQRRQGSKPNLSSDQRRQVPTNSFSDRKSQLSQVPPNLSSDKRSQVPSPDVYLPNCGQGHVLCGINETLMLGGPHKNNLNQLKQHFHRLVTNESKQICPDQRWFGSRSYGYQVCFTEPFQPRHNSCLVYSFGIGGDWTFDAALGKFGCEVHSFDPSIGRRDGKLAPNVNFHAVGLWGSDTLNSRRWRLNKLSTVRQKLGHTHRILDVLKVDVEIGEWPFLRNVVDEEPWQLISVRQIIFELHTPVRRGSQRVTANNMLEIIHYFQRLEQLGFVLYLERRMKSRDPGCCGNFMPFMPAGVRDRCCYEPLYVNTGRVVAT